MHATDIHRCLSRRGPRAAIAAFFVDRGPRQIRRLARALQAHAPAAAFHPGRTNTGTKAATMSCLRQRIRAGNVVPKVNIARKQIKD
ncbi:MULTISPECIES: hypothetical protein [unclassified Herbaspirillum]|uniref:hypothetical protein n=1 Tax=unclassified Herbaspirillum TaxID=2624150 RepID=UPI0011511908|nr:MULTISPECIES: hypothetical protein [unclassified Herbaspirillum]MBB5392402.1 hypothetical protein [Herbaspirillum sp. SJZ102]